MANLIAIDFDDTICFKGMGKDRVEDWFDGVPMPAAKEIIEKLLDKGYEVEILTARGPEEWGRIKEWLLNYNFPDLVVTNVKKPALCYIDNRAIRFTGRDNGWADIAFLYL